ncbi:uncharacterized protein LOC131077477 [Cryptomeria japonica]|uniref:uncharacterized protein LOC131077477 n=1 Tax=Cryptomeria japonica TaxID=3369 RepID=UPI0027DA5EB6|nr:uncharacterized protein LOC131077477 [Cryptomeria japonica]
MDVRSEELYHEVSGFLSSLWRSPIYLVYFVYFGPRLVRMVMFFCPLLVSTCLLMLIVFSVGPQLERIRIEGHLQWLRFREASLRQDKGFSVMSGVKRPLICRRDLWIDLFRGLYGSSQEPILLSENPLMVNKFSGEGLKVEFEKCGGFVTSMAEGKTVDPSQSVILSKLGEVMDRLVAELGGEVQCDILNALEVIIEALIQTTQSPYEEDRINSSSSAFRTAKDREASDKSVEEAKALENFPDKLVDLHCRSLDIQGEFPLIDIDNVDSLTQVAGPFTNENVPHRIDLEACENEVDASSFHGDAFKTSVLVPESFHEEPCTAQRTEPTDISQVSEQDNGILDSNQTHPSESEKGLPSLKNCVFRSCRIFPVDNSGEEFLPMDRLWEQDDRHAGLLAFEKSPATRKEKDWKRTLACKLLEEQQNQWRGTLVGKFSEERSSILQSQLSPSVKIPENQSYTDFFGSKSTSSSSDSPAFTSTESPLIAEDMDLLWEEYNDVKNYDPESDIKGLAKSLAKLRSLRGNVESDTDEGPETPKLCCLKAFRFSPGKIPLRKPNLVKFSKALKNFGFIQHIRGPRQHPS